MKKYIVFVILLILISGCGKNPLFTILSNPNLLLENYETYSLGNFVDGTGGWTIFNVFGVNPLIAIDGSVYKIGNKSLKIVFNTSYSQIILSKSFTTTAQVVFADMYIFTTGAATSGGGALGLSLGKVNSSAPMENLAVLIGANAYTINGEGYFGIVSYKSTGTVEGPGGKGKFEQITTNIKTIPDTWYKMKIKLDTTNKSWDVWINDVQPTTGGSGTYDTLSGAATDVFLFLGGGNNTCYYIDEIKVYKQ